LREKSMRHESFPGPGGQAKEHTHCLVGALCWAPDGPAAPCGSKKVTPRKILFPPMLFARNALASGPQAGFFAAKGIAKVGKRGAFLLTILFP